MRLFGAGVKLEQLDDEDGLRFRVTSQRTVRALIVPVIAGIGLVYAWHRDIDQLGLLGILALLALSVWRWFKVRIVELRVTALELVAEGDLHPVTGTLWLQWFQIANLQYLSGGELEGLYALNESGARVCVVPYINEAQAGEMIHAIYCRFPDAAMADEPERRSLADSV